MKSESVLDINYKASASYRFGGRRAKYIQRSVTFHRFGVRRAKYMQRSVTFLLPSTRDFCAHVLSTVTVFIQNFSMLKMNETIGDGIMLLDTPHYHDAVLGHI